MALMYMKLFYPGTDIEEVREILAEDLSFAELFHKFNSAEYCINSLTEDPPGGMRYKVIKCFEDKKSACLIY